MKNYFNETIKELQERFGKENVIPKPYNFIEVLGENSQYLVEVLEDGEIRSKHRGYGKDFIWTEWEESFPC